MEDKKFGVRYEELEAIGFKNFPHIHNFMNYLFRTDKAQKSTNDLTNGNLYFFFNPEENKLFLGDFGKSLDNRKDIQKDCYKKLYKIMRDSPDLELVTNLVYFDVSLQGVDVTKDLKKEDLMAVFKEMVNSLYGNPTKSIFVMHVDQEGLYHIHALYMEERALFDG